MLTIGFITKVKLLVDLNFSILFKIRWKIEHTINIFLEMNQLNN